MGKPIGAISDDKMEQFKSKYFEIINKTSHSAINTSHYHLKENEKPYMFLSHYSTPGIVLYYIIRKIPYNIMKV